MLEKLFSQGWLGKPAPPLDAVAWLNTKPLSMAKLRGKVVLVDFWTYSCINCQRTLPYLKQWHEDYSRKGLVIIGVHTPEFEFEKDVDNVRQAVKKHGIEYAVAVDSDHKTWNNYRNKWWPRKLLVDKKGAIAYDHAGEGAYSETEGKIVELLGLKTTITKEETAAQQRRVTPEIYAGHLRNQGLGNGVVCLPGDCSSYSDPKHHRSDVIYLEGEWAQHEEHLQHEKKRGHLALKYTASEVNAVLDAERTARAEILLNDKPLKDGEAGDDVVMEGGKSFVIVTHPDMYSLVKGGHGTNEIKIITEDRLKVFAFTFG
ncbi:MAG: redoxin domain-containing protein [Candidatus Aenigmarchaeota archaeon]|nr:redoxin domain-containing protein [Candidatus Aenigmarchaeota archaeon]